MLDEAAQSRIGALVKPAHLVLKIRSLSAHDHAEISKTRSDMWENCDGAQQCY